jgi:hypothetical protein
MALHQTGNYMAIHSQRYKVAQNVWKCIAGEALNGIKMIF